MVKRLLRHLLTDRWHVARCFPVQTREAVMLAIARAESQHQGEIQCVVEGALPPRAIWQKIRPRARALALFSHLRIWDTEHNNGVLIYVLLADHAVEIVVDRGIDARCASETWTQIAAQIQVDFAAGQYSDGLLNAIGRISAELAAHFPKVPGTVSTGPGELSNEVIML